MSEKLKVGVIGNCQADPLAKLMQANPLFCEKYEVSFSVALHRIEDFGFFLSSLHDCDIIFTQPFKQISGNAFGLKDLKASLNKKIFVFPNLYFEGYYPFYGYLHSRRNKKLKPSYDDYVNFLMLSLYLKDVPRNDFVEIYDAIVDESSLLIERNAEHSLAELRTRDVECDFGVADFIEENYKLSLLFKTINHPTRIALDYAAGKICQLLDCDGPIVKTSYNPLNNSVMEIHPAIERALSLHFKGTIDPYFSRIYSFSELLDVSLDFFSRQEKDDLLHGLNYFLQFRPEMQKAFASV